MGKWAGKIRKHKVIATASLIAAAAIIYLAVIPSVVARHYFTRLGAGLASVESSFKSVAASGGLSIFNNPDISLPERQRQLNQAAARVRQAQAELKELTRSSQLTVLPGAGFAGDYHAATVKEEQARNIVQQGGQVLAEYVQLLQYLSAYTSLQHKLGGYLDNVNSVNNFDALKGRGGGMAGTATLIEGDTKVLQTLMPPAEFEPLQTEAISSFNQAADGFDKLAAGLNQASDSNIYRAVNSLESTTLKSQIRDKDLLVALADNSPTLRQVAELPEKLEHAQER